MSRIHVRSGHIVGAATVAVFAAPTLAFAAPPSASASEGARTGHTKTVSRSVDVDGDGRRDSISLTYNTAHEGFGLRVRTAAGRTATIRASTSGVIEQGLSPWFGTGGLDGVRGAEILAYTGFGDLGHATAFTWRGGTLVRLGSPDEAGGTWTVNTGYADMYSGYSFRTSRGVRIVTAYDLATKTASGRFYGPATTYRWSAKGWRKVSSIKVSLTASQATRATNWRGVTIAR